MKRIVFEVRWTGSQWWIYRGSNKCNLQKTKAGAVKVAAFLARREFQTTGQPAELIIKNKDGSIGKGRGSRRSYGNDPKRSKG